MAELTVGPQWHLTQQVIAKRIHTELVRQILRIDLRKPGLGQLFATDEQKPVHIDLLRW